MRLLGPPLQRQHRHKSICSSSGSHNRQTQQCRAPLPQITCLESPKRAPHPHQHLLLPVPRQMGMPGQEEQVLPGNPSATSLGVPRNLAQSFPPSNPLHPHQLGLWLQPPSLEKAWRRAEFASPAVMGGTDREPRAFLSEIAASQLKAKPAAPQDPRGCRWLQRPQGSPQHLPVGSASPQGSPHDKHPQLPLPHAPLVMGSGSCQPPSAVIYPITFPPRTHPGRMLPLQCKALPSLGGKTDPSLCGCRPLGLLPKRTPLGCVNP